VQRLLVLSATISGLTLPLLVPSHAQQVGQVQVGGTPTVSADLVAGPVPRLPDGKPDLTGPWVGGGSDQDMERDGGLKPGELTSLLLPWAKELRATREKAIYEEPYIYCLPMSVPRVNPYPWKFAMSYTSKGLTQIYLLHETGDAGAHRVVYMDGRKHPVDPIPTWWGHSIGRWEGDTLVVDTVGFAPGYLSTPVRNSDKLHVVERFSLDPKKMELTRSYVAEDPVYLKGKYTGSDVVQPADAPFNPGKCQELNFIDYSKQQKK
jgi:hypothetical protein